MQAREHDPPDGVWAVVQPPWVKGLFTAGGAQGDGEHMLLGDENTPAVQVIAVDPVEEYPVLHVGVHVEADGVEAEQEEE